MAWQAKWQRRLVLNVGFIQYPFFVQSWPLVDQSCQLSFCTTLRMTGCFFFFRKQYFTNNCVDWCYHANIIAFHVTKPQKMQRGKGSHSVIGILTLVENACLRLITLVFNLREQFSYQTKLSEFEKRVELFLETEFIGLFALDILSFSATQLYACYLNNTLFSVFSAEEHCVDLFSWCHLVPQHGVCNHKFYGQQCCKSCSSKRP